MAALRLLLFPLLAVGSAPGQSDLHAGLTPDQLAFFEKHIRPALVEHCYECHAADSKKIRGGLLLDTKQGSLLGGESGHPGVTPGEPGASSLYSALTWQNPDLEMPPKKKLPDDVIANFKKWIEMGAPDPRESTVANAEGGRRQIDMEEGRKHWAFQKPVQHEPPAVKTEDWAKTDIDRFLLASMEAAGLSPVADANRPALIRRIAFDLTGLPPTPDEVKAFVADSSSNAMETVIDGYLDSPRFGERWARHWLDVARYAESNGKETNLPYPHAWRYRDYVIESFNRDKPYDQFIKEQIAGDLLRYDDERGQAEQIIATGFLALGPKGLNDRDRRQFTMDLVDEQIDVMSQSMLGLTLACARCHDHKFDPVTQRDYYALAGIFLSSETLYGTHAQQQNNHPSTLIELDRNASQPAAIAAISAPERQSLQSEVDRLRGQMDDASQEVLAARRNGTERNQTASFLRVRQARDRTASAQSDLNLFDASGKPRTLTMGMLDRASAVNSPLLVRGDVSQPSDIVPRGLVEVLCSSDEPRSIGEGSGRLDLAYWIASPDNPLTTRVMANRIWLKLMGQGIVATPDNFGFMGMKPSHPELLDHLAISLMENGWSLKKLIKQIMLSRAYQMSSTHDASNYSIDPGNKHRWRMDQRRLDAEAIRDAMLAVAGVLDPYPVDGSPVARVREDRQGMVQLFTQLSTQPYPYRSIYLPIIRDQIPDFLGVFDFPDASLVNGQRDTTNVPSQSLFLMNNAQAIALADAFAKRLGEYDGSPLERLTHAYHLAFSRSPTSEELAAIRGFWMDFPNKLQTVANKTTAEGRKRAELLALTSFCQALFASAEFRYLN